MASKQRKDVDLHSFCETLYARLQQGHVSEVRNVLRSYDDSFNDARFHMFVRNLYADLPLLTVGPHQYACVAIEAPAAQQHDVDSILNSDLATPKHDCRVAVPEYQQLIMELVRHEGGPTYNGRKFVLTHLESVSPLKLVCHLSTYFDVIASCDAIKLEIQRAWVDSLGRIATLKDPLEHLPLRGRMHRAASPFSPIWNGECRTVGLSTSTLICYRSYDDDRVGYKCLLRLRAAEKLAEGRGGFHVIPAGSFEPGAADIPKKSYSVRENVIREFGEEIFDVPERRDAADVFWYHQEPPNEYLIGLLNSGNATMHLTGFSSNLLDLRTEICTLLLIHDPDWENSWLRKRGKIRWEFEQTTGATSHVGRSFWLDKDAALISAVPELCPSRLHAPGAAAFWLGVRLARKQIACESHSASRTMRIRSMRDDPRGDGSGHRIGDDDECVLERRLKDGESMKRQMIFRSDALRVVADSDIDIVIDECHSEIRTESGRTSFNQLSEMARGLLWFILARGGGELSYEDLFEYFEINHHTDLNLNAKRNKIHRCKSDLARKGLGCDLTMRVIQTGRHCYCVFARGWSYCWIRRSSNVDSSVLKYRGQKKNH